jgi:hypothetical protein
VWVFLWILSCTSVTSLHRECVVVFLGLLDPCLSLLNIYLKRSPPAFFEKKNKIYATLSLLFRKMKCSTRNFDPQVIYLPTFKSV